MAKIETPKAYRLVSPSDSSVYVYRMNDGYGAALASHGPGKTLEAFFFGDTGKDAAIAMAQALDCFDLTVEEVPEGELEYGKMEYETIAFVTSGEDAEVAEWFDGEGDDETIIEYLLSTFGPSEGSERYKVKPWSDSDSLTEFERSGERFVLVTNAKLGYVSLTRLTVV